MLPASQASQYFPVWNSTARRGKPERRIDLPRLRIDEEGNPDAGIGQAPHQGAQRVKASSRVEASFGGDLLTPLGHHAAGMRQRHDRKRGHFLSSGHFEIERRGHLGLQPPDIIVADVPPVLAQMRRYAIRSGLNREFGGANWIGAKAAPCVPEGCDVIDIQAKPDRALPLYLAGH